MNDFLSCCMFYNLCSRSKFLSQFVLSFDFRNSSRFFFLCTDTQTRVIRTKTPATDKPATRLNRALKWVEVGQYISPVAWVGLTFWA
jgi:hypothetical protein